MKKTRRKYTREFKLEALRLLETSGKSATQIERDLGIGSGNLYRWKHKLAQKGEHAFSGCSDPQKLDRYDSSSRICPKGETECQSDEGSRRSSRPG